MNEEDTYKKLKQVPYDQLIGSYKKNPYNILISRKHFDQEQKDTFLEFLRMNGWTVEDFNEETLRRQNVKIEERKLQAKEYMKTIDIKTLLGHSLAQYLKSVPKE
jgi:hypothetical protein